MDISTVGFSAVAGADISGLVEPAAAASCGALWFKRVAKHLHESWIIDGLRRLDSADSSGRLLQKVVDAETLSFGAIAGVLLRSDRSGDYNLLVAFAIQPAKLT